MQQLTIRGISVQVPDEIPMTLAIKDMAKQYIDTRYARSVVAFPNPAGTPGHAIRFATAEEDARHKNDPDAVVLRVHDAACRIIPLYGVKPSQIDETEKNIARSLWTESLFIDEHQGHAFIDD